MNTPRIDTWLTEWATLWRALDLANRVQVEPGRRLRRSLGRCEPASGQVTIHPVLFEPENTDLFREVVCHESAHVAVHLLHGRGARPHGREWQGLVAAAGYLPETKMDPRRLPERLQTTFQPRFSYRYTCPVCSATWMAHRRVNRWRCRVCYDAGLEGKLQIVRVTPD